MTPADLPVPACPRCAGPMFDNRKSKVSSKAPDFRCKDAACLGDDGQRTAIWARDLVRKAAKAPGPPTPPASPPPAAPREKPPAPPAPALELSDHVQHLAELQHSILAHVVVTAGPLLVKLGGDVAGAVTNLTAHLFAAAVRQGSTR